MNKQEQIEEMEVDLLLYLAFSKNGGVKCGDTAEALYNAGYRVVPDGAVILTPEERDEEMKEINKTLAERDELKAEIVELKSKIEELKLKCAALFPKGKHPSE